VTLEPLGERHDGNRSRMRRASACRRRSTFVGRAGDDLHAVRGQRGADGRHAEGSRGNCAWIAWTTDSGVRSGANTACHKPKVEAGHDGLGDRGQRIEPGSRERDERRHCEGADRRVLPERGIRARHHEVDAAGDEVGEYRRRAAVRHVRRLDAEARDELRGAEMRRVAIPDEP
jgi:hypothetical protein